MIGAPVTLREKAVFYTVGLPFLLGSMAWYRALSAASGALSRIERGANLGKKTTRVRAEIVPAAQVSLEQEWLVGSSRLQGGRLTVWVSVPEEGTAYSIGMFLLPHEVSLLRITLEERSTMTVRFGAHSAMGPDRLCIHIPGEGELGGGIRGGHNWVQVANIAELRAQLAGLKIEVSRD